jgi:polyisoprenoid-binding protein YceI
MNKYRNQRLLLPALFSVILGVQATQVAQAETTRVTFDQGTGSTEFHATGHPSAIKVVGKGKGPTGAFSVNGLHVSGEIRFDLSSLDTGIDMRTRHMKEKYLEVQKDPEARLTLTKLDLPNALSNGAKFNQVPFEGTLQLHGKNHLVTGLVDASRTDNQVSINATLGLKIADYGILLPTFAGITMADDVQIVVQSDAKLDITKSSSPK